MACALGKSKRRAEVREAASILLHFLRCAFVPSLKKSSQVCRWMENAGWIGAGFVFALGRAPS
jgi:hypothetical protein